MEFVQNGLGIAFDTYQNASRGDIVNDSTYFLTTQTRARTAYVDLGNIEDGLYHPIVINWNAATTTLTYTVDGILRGTLISPNYATAYFGGSNFAHFGFTASTGGGFNLQQVKAIDLDVVYEGKARPVANTDIFQTSLNTPLAIQASQLLGNDTDADGDTLTLVSVSNAVNGTVSLVNGVVTLTPNASFTGAASFNYKISDGFGAMATGIATVNVIGAANSSPPVTKKIRRSPQVPRGMC
jgi:Cadherin-like domain/Bacterial lectin